MKCKTCNIETDFVTNYECTKCNQITDGEKLELPEKYPRSDWRKTWEEDQA